MTGATVGAGVGVYVWPGGSGVGAGRSVVAAASVAAIPALCRLQVHLKMSLKHTSQIPAMAMILHWSHVLLFSESLSDQQVANVARQLENDPAWITTLSAFSLLKEL